MKFKNFFTILSFLFLILICLSSVSASQDNNITEVNHNILSSDESESLLASSNTINVDNINSAHNEMNEHTIRNAISSANAGDTIIINGKSYEHVHIVINKKLTIKSTVGTTLMHCSNQGAADSGYQGIFYLTKDASGTIIEGFNFRNDNGMLYNSEGYGIYINGASNVVIRNCNISNNGYGDCIRIINGQSNQIQNVNLSSAVNSIRIINSQNDIIKQSFIENSVNGINLINSTKTTLTSNIINSNKNSGISVSGTSNNPIITFNNITNNGYGVELLSSDNIDILNNYIAFNTKYGVYVNCSVIKIKINGNFFNQNQLNEVFNDLAAKNLWTAGGEKLEQINNNYMIGVGERAVYRSFTGGVFLGYVFEINENVNCPVIYFNYQATQWSLSGNYELQLSEITQTKKGIYSISIVDENGNIASDLSSVPVTFYLNKADSKSTPQEGDVYRVVMMQNGTATARFYSSEFAQSGNVITAVVPTPGTLIDAKVSKTFAVKNDDIPGTPSDTKIVVSNLNTYPNSNQYFTAVLTDNKGSVIPGEILTFTFNSKTYKVSTNQKGQAQIKISESKGGTYTVKVSYAGDDIDYNPSSTQAKVVVKKLSTKIIASNFNMVPKLSDYYSVTLKDSSGKVLSNQKITFKVNGKSYTKKTNSGGVAKVKLKFNKNKKTYAISIKFKGNNVYKAVSTTKKITVKFSSKKAYLTAPKITIPLKKSTKYTITLKDSNNKGLSKQMVVIKIVNKKYTKKTNSKGQITIPVKFTLAKTYKVSVSYKGSKIYKKASSKGYIKCVKTYSTSITAPTLSMNPWNLKTYTVILKANNKGLANQKLSIQLDGKTYTKTTNSNGQASISVNFSNENSYNVYVSYGGSVQYKSCKATGHINVVKINSQILSYNKTYSSDLTKDYIVSLKDASGNVLANQSIIFGFNNENVTKITDNDGKATFNINLTDSGIYEILITYEGNNRYNSISKTNKINISDVNNTIFVDNNLLSSAIQDIFDRSDEGSSIEFLGDNYNNISLNVNKSLNVYSNVKSILNTSNTNSAFSITSDNVNITGFSIYGSSNNAITINNGSNILFRQNYISNNIDLEKYSDGKVNLPYYGVSISNSTNVMLLNNTIDLFESGIFSQFSSNLTIANNTITKNNYGIKYAFGVSNSLIANNTICDSIGLYIFTVPEGPTGYGIFLNNSAVNVTINNNHIFSNHMGISLDANYSTGIVITQNTITDNVLEGIRFNAGYDLAENAVEPIVEDNAIYRNARGPSMMILGELSANPEGIYGKGLYNASYKLQLGSNWYGTNNLTTWDLDTGNIGYGTMCPRINTTAIKFNNITYNGDTFEIVFYKGDEIASNLPEFELYATLNRDIEIVFNVIDGIGQFKFNNTDYKESDNLIEVSIGSLLYSTSRFFKVLENYTLTI